MLDGEQAAHAKVLRLSRGDEVTLCDGAGTDALCRVDSLSGGQLVLEICSTAPSRSEPKLQCSIYMGFPKADKFEHVIQKATELGACELVIFPAAEAYPVPMENPSQKSWSAGKKLPPRRQSNPAAEEFRRFWHWTLLMLPSSVLHRQSFLPSFMKTNGPDPFGPPSKPAPLPPPH